MKFTKTLFLILFISCCSCNQNILFVNPTATLMPTLPANLMDQSWWRDQPCRTPCWYGMTLGRTSQDESRKIIRQLSFMDSASEQSSVGGDWDYSKQQYFGVDRLSYECQTTGNFYCVVLTFASDKLIEIELIPNYSITFAEIVAKIGPPDYVWASAVTPEIIDCAVELIWVDRQLDVRYYETEKESGRDLCQMYRGTGNKPIANLQVNTVRILELKQLQAEINEYRDSYKPWSGFAK